MSDSTMMLQTSALSGANLEMFVDDLVEFAVGLPPANDFAFTLFHESDTESLPATPTATEKATDATMAAKDTAEPKHATGDDVSFVEKTYYMINSCPKHLACWNASGTGFLVVETEKFAREVLPDYFKHRNFNSFVCELTLHGFRKTTLSNKKAGLECVEFRHPNFLRGKVELLSKVERRQSTSPEKNVNSPAPVAEPVESEEVVEAVDDLKFQISELQGEVQQTQQLFDKLLSSLLQTPAPQPQPQFQHMMRPQPYMTCAPLGYNVYNVMNPAAAGLYHGFGNRVAMGMPPNMSMLQHPLGMVGGDFGFFGQMEEPLMDLFYKP
ncbi:hypothetical protein Poli38472_005587 [Pythium oligandrum]|uniref:HSF-type DNA-binding domain-containing protein n=1 Tax=Pythium oligandrum TaxID=41045 RepID=A0A8K1FJC1_PYTOL|nr:hypothetical protein Poli38472_005587 [Pythium oligandrum]|eukprot:TMW62969.1 hypothetical protein Poli38472_005587 [Pythium oligandrum]